MCGMPVTYTVKMSGGYRFQFAADFREASAPIYSITEDGERVTTRYQVADARHRPWLAAELMWGLEKAGADGAECIVSVSVAGQECCDDCGVQKMPGHAVCWSDECVRYRWQVANEPPEDGDNDVPY
jgi:hypothetical protein